MSKFGIEPSAARTLQSVRIGDDRRARRRARVERAEWLLQCVGIAALLDHLGSRELSAATGLLLAVVLVAAAAGLAAAVALRWIWRDPSAATPDVAAAALVSAAWLVGLAGLGIAGALGWTGWETAGRWALLWTEIGLVIRAGIALGVLMRHVAVLDVSPAFVVVASFVALIAVGTGLLLLPSSRVDGAPAPEGTSPFLAALFTATSASCVTGLVVVDTEAYWTRSGQCIILGLIQIGGLGMMAFGAFFALLAGRRMVAREGAMLRDLMEANQIAEVRRLVLAMLLFTVVSELVGAVLISGLWADRDWGERAFQSLFHSVSAFCNAGFALFPDGRSFVGLGTRSEVWGGMCGLVILGGIGFGVLSDLHRKLSVSASAWFARRPTFRLPKAQARLSLHSVLVLSATSVLLIGGAAAIWLFDGGGPLRQGTPAEQLSASWIQSVMARTAGFNTIDVAQLSPGSKLILAGLMFVGASPISTGGGIKTAAFGVIVLAVWSVLRSRENVEFQSRTIPDAIVKRALTIAAVGVVALMAGTLFLATVEGQPEKFIDHLFEAASALGTVGLSTVNTMTLSTPSKYALAVMMLMGRVGPLTLLLAVARPTSTARYQYPTERVVLG